MLERKSGRVGSKSKGRTTRSKTGCFTCRRRKLKCDENKPKCKGCSRGSFECMWPSVNNMSLPHTTDFVPQKEKRSNQGLRFIVSVVHGNDLRRVDEVNTEGTSFERLRTMTSARSDAEKLAEKSQSVPATILKKDVTPRRSSFGPNGGIPSVRDERSTNSIYGATGDFENITTLAKMSFLPHHTGDLLINSRTQTEQDEFVEECEDSNLEEIDKIDGALNTKKKDYTFSSIQRLEYQGISQSNLNGYNSWIPGIKMSSQEAYLFHVFINGFIVAISPQNSHPNLMPGAIFVPQGIHSQILRDIFYACGASFLCWKDPELKVVAQRKYASCLAKLATFMNSSDIDGTEDWMMTAMLLLCLREKHYGAIPSKPAAHLTMAFRIIRKRQRKDLRQNGYGQDITRFDTHWKNKPSSQRDPYGLSSNILPITLENQPFDSSIVSGKSQFYNPGEYEQIRGPWNETNNEFDPLCNTDQSAFPLCLPNFEVSSTQKLLVESFLYNYSVQLLITERKLISHLPSPYDIFGEFSSLLQHPVYDCPVPWMNNPVFGAAARAFEIAAKASWLCFQSPLDDIHMQMAQRLYLDAMLYTAPHLPQNSDISKIAGLKESVLVADIVARASYILISKIVNINLSQNNEEVQENVAAIYSAFQQLPAHSAIWCICGWPLVVTGVATTCERHKEYIQKRCMELSEILHAEHMTQIAHFLQEAWGDSSNPGKGWDTLLDRSCLQKICI